MRLWEGPYLSETKAEKFLGHALEPKRAAGHVSMLQQCGQVWGGSRPAEGTKRQVALNWGFPHRIQQARKWQKTKNCSAPLQCKRNAPTWSNKQKLGPDWKKRPKSAECWWLWDDGPVCGLDNGRPAKWSTPGSNWQHRHQFVNASH